MWYNIFMKALLRSPVHALISHNIVLVTVMGRKSGKPVTLPVNYLQVGDSLLVTSLRTRTWWRNLRGGSSVRLLLRGSEVSACGEVLETQTEVTGALGDLFTAAPMMARYFNIRLDADHRPVLDDLQEAARSRVVVRLRTGV